MRPASLLCLLATGVHAQQPLQIGFGEYTGPNDAEAALIDANDRGTLREFAAPVVEHQIHFAIFAETHVDGAGPRIQRHHFASSREYDAR